MQIINEQSLVINKLNLQINVLEKTGLNAREVSVNCIK